MKEDVITIKKEEDMLIYCYSCGKKTVYMHATTKYLFYCDNCEHEFAMMDKETLLKLTK